MQLFLTSQIDKVAKHLVKQLDFGNTNPRTAFIYTAAESESGSDIWLKANRQVLVNVGLDVFDYTITGKNYDQLTKDLNDIDILYVNGGNTFYLLLQSRLSGFIKFVQEFTKTNKIYIGCSAGSVITAPNIDIMRTKGKDDYFEELKSYESYNLVDFNILPHWGRQGKDATRRKQRVIDAFREENKIILLNDYQYVMVHNNFYRIIDIRTDK